MESIVDLGEGVHFYEYMESDILQGYIRSGINYFVNAILNSQPSFVTIRYFTNEITTLIDFVKDFYYLIKHNATYA
jgi:hypothetical protein